MRVRKGSGLIRRHALTSQRHANRQSGYSAFKNGGPSTRIRNRQPSKILLALMLIAVCVVSVMAAGTAAVKLRHRYDLDEHLCQRGMATETHVAYVVDLTDGLSGDGFRAFKDEIYDRVGELEVNDRISLYVIQKEEGDTVVRDRCLFNRCRPRDGSKANPIIESGKKMKAVFDNAFMKRLTQAIEGIEPKQTAKRSPILETLRAIYRQSDFAAAKRRELYYFGNLMENSANINQYKSGWKDFERLKSLNLRVLDVESLLANTVVTAYLIPDRGQSEPHRIWWHNYFSHTAASVFTFKRL